MTGALAPDDLRGVGELLDRAVHQTFARFWLIVPPFVLADALGSLLFDLPLNGVAGYLVLILAAMICENRARVVAIASAPRADRRGPDWSQLVRHPAALAFAVVGMLEYLIPLVAVGVAGMLFLIVRLPLIFGASRGVPALYVLGEIAAFTAGVGLLVVLTLVALAGLAATIDTVLDGTAPHRALGRWLRRTFRRRSFGATFLAAGAVVLLVVGVPALLSVVFPWGTHEERILVSAIPEGIGDAIALMFAWRWRDTELARREGRDIEALLDQVSSSASPSATSPGVTTSQ